jgi:hypothetical protein
MEPIRAVEFELNIGFMELKATMDKNNVMKCGFAKPNIYWLGRWFLVQTAEDEADLVQDIRDVRGLLDEE